VCSLTAVGLWARQVRPHLPSGTTSLHLTPIRTGKYNAPFWVESDKGRFVLRLAPPDDSGFLFYERRMMHQEPDLTPVPLGLISM
jgi:hypothetical protein